MTFVGINLGEAQVGDVAVELAHNGFYTCTQVWLKLRNGARGWGSTQSYKDNITTPHTLRRVSPLVFERQRSVPRIGDMWIPKLFASLNHFIKLYILGVEDLFQNGDHLIKVEHNGSRSRIISWRIWQNLKERWQFQTKSTMSKVSSLYHLILCL
jgi:hypothetical protein